MLVDGPAIAVRPVDTQRAQNSDRHTNVQSSSHSPQPHALRRRLTEADRARIIAAYEAGSSTNKLANEWQLAKGSILNILRDSGTTIRQQRRLTSDEIDHAITSYHNGESLERIGKRLGVAHTTIRTTLQRRGIPRRNSKYPE